VAEPSVGPGFLGLKDCGAAGVIRGQPGLPGNSAHAHRSRIQRAAASAARQSDDADAAPVDLMMLEQVRAIAPFNATAFLLD
jgi:hypothetical protein